MKELAFRIPTRRDPEDAGNTGLRSGKRQTMFLKRVGTHRMRYRMAALLIVLAVFIVLPMARAFAAPKQAAGEPKLKVLAVETFLADIARNVAGNRQKVVSLLPVGAEPHGFEPTPADAARVAECNVLIVNGAGMEEFLDKLLLNAGGTHKIIDASQGLTGRTPAAGEPAEAGGGHENEDATGAQAQGEHHQHEGDPHFWLAPGNVVRYAVNIRDGLSQADPEGAEIYAANADAYITQLRNLDKWIEEQVDRIPKDRRLIVTNHESLGYFADRYGFRIVGTIIPSVSTEASPSARQLAHLIDTIKATGARAIFLETGTNPQMAQQVAKETGMKVVTDLYTHSVTEPNGPAPGYIEMMKYNTGAIVNALR